MFVLPSVRCGSLCDGRKAARSGRDEKRTLARVSGRHKTIVRINYSSLKIPIAVDRLYVA